MFPGQGAQRAGMGADLAAAFPLARAVFDEVDDALGEALSRAMFAAGDGAALARTATAQPALLAHAVAALRVLGAEAGLAAPGAPPPRALLGHSVGEYAALVAGGALGLADAARLLRVRGLAMQAAADADARARGGAPHAMLALIVAPAAAARAGGGADAGGAGGVAGGAAGGAAGDAFLAAAEAAARAACARAAAATGLVAAVAAVNAPTQVVLSGHAAALTAAVADLRGGGGGGGALLVRRATPLAVSAPFHCAIMAPAAAALRDALDGAGARGAAAPLLRRATAPLFAGVSAGAVREPAEVRAALVDGVAAPVRWAAAVAAADAAAATADGSADAAEPPPHFLELGAGAALSGFVRALRPAARVSTVGTVADVRAFVLAAR
jgi:[acyl-carrier-protein] S-malonyltransferase